MSLLNTDWKSPICRVPLCTLKTDTHESETSAGQLKGREIIRLCVSCLPSHKKRQSSKGIFDADVQSMM